jgi:SAM-dependent methyltransferase
MELEQYIRALEAGPPPTGPAGEDRSRELRYMREHTFRFRAMLAAMPESTAALRIVDIGVTQFTIFLRRRFPQHEFWAVDLNDASRPRCVAAGIEHRVCNLNCEKLPLADESFDLAIFTETLEHIYAPPSRVLADIRRVLKPGGRLILSVPNFAALHKRIKLLLGRQILPDADQVFKGDGTGHLHEYTLAEISGLVRCAGFRIERRACLTWSVAETLACRHRPLRDRLVRSVYHLVQSAWPTFRTTLFLVTTRL